jgi:hypothetical protein
MAQKKYKTTTELLTDLSLSQVDVNFIFDYILRFGPVSFDKDTRILIIKTPILNYREDIEHEGVIFKIRIEDDVKIKHKRAEA